MKSPLLWMATFLVTLTLASTADAQGNHVTVGDMILDADLLQPASAPVVDGSTRPGVDTPSLAGTGAQYNSRYWTNGDIPFDFDASFTETQKNQLFQACLRWSQVAGVRCLTRQSEAAYVKVRPSAGCNAYIGMPLVGEATLNMHPTCFFTAALVHEIGHLLGFLHEHQRTDRDAYVMFDRANIAPSVLPQLFLISTSRQLGDYDFLSIMHPQWNSYSIDWSRASVIPVRPEDQRFARTMGAGLQGGPSVLDAEGARVIYGPSVQPIPTSRMSLTITNRVTRAPIDGAVVRLQAGATEVSFASNASGLAAADVAHATYTVTISAPGYTPTGPVGYTHATALVSAVELVPADDGLNTVRVAFTGGGAPLQGVALRIGNVSGESGTDGVVVLEVPAGTYPVSVTKPGYAPVSFAAVPIVSDITHALPMTSLASFSVQFVDAGNDSPIPSTVVTLNGTDYLADNNGVVRIASLPAGSYVASVRANGYLSVTNVPYQHAVGFSTRLRLTRQAN